MTLTEQLEASIQAVQREKQMKTNGVAAPVLSAPDAAGIASLERQLPSQGNSLDTPAVYAGICQVAKAISRNGIAKAGRNQQQGYAFRGIDQIMNAISGLLAEADLCILPRMRSRTQEEHRTKDDKALFYVTVQADFAIVSARDGSRHTVSTFGEAMDSGDKATNKAMTAAYKYMLTQAFCIPVEGQPDADETTPEPEPSKPAGRKPTAAQRRVADAKIAAMRKGPQPAAAMAEQIPEPHEEQPYYDEVPMSQEERAQLEDELAKKAMIEAFAALKQRYLDLGALKTFFAILGLHGASRPEAFADLEKGRACYLEMRDDIKAREARRAV